MKTKTLIIGMMAAVMASGVAFAQEKTGVQPEGPSNGEQIEGGVLPGFVCSAEGGSNCSGALLDDQPGVTSTFDISGCGEIIDVNIGVDISHTFVGDLTVTVAAPGQAAISLIDRPGVPATTFGCSGDDIFAVLNDGAASPVENECAAATPTIDGGFTPNAALSAFNGLSADGTWTLVAADVEPVGSDEGSLNDWSVDVFTDTCGEPEGTEPIARFAVEKFFDDGNPAEVEVDLSCNTGLPLEQSSTIAEGDGVVFVVTDFENGAMNCTVTEGGAAGYATEYFDGFNTSDEGCTFENVTFESVHSCDITNSLQPVNFEVTKEWIDENPQFNAFNIAEANYSCSGEQFGDAAGQLEFFGNPGFDSFEVFPHWNGLTTCTVTESFVEGGVEADSSDCQSVSVTPGNDAACTIVNTRLFEGIPTLSRYGLGVLALLMLGVGFVAFRRMV